MNPTFRSGYDQPTDKDLLDHWPLAERIADVIRTTPASHGVRIGLFGEWGSGKSSILGFVKRLLEPDHLVVFFSPWGCGDLGAMWTSLGAALVDALRQHGTQPSWLKRTKVKHAADLQQALNAARSFTDYSEVTKPLGAFATLAASKVAALCRITSDTLLKLAEGHRITVLVDDLDRTDPSLIPPLLFGLRELLDVPAFSWITAFAPDLVNAALEKHNPAYATGPGFLEKILEFTFHVPDTTQEQRWRLARHDMRALACPFTENDLEPLFELFPTNPRRLRAAIRHLSTLVAVVRAQRA